VKCIAQMEDMNSSFTLLAGKPKRKKPLGRPRQEG
jgi:hypothetical protein